MIFPVTSRIRRAAVFAAATGLVVALSACQPTSEPSEPAPAPDAASGLPSTHIHGLHVGAGGETDQVLLATHVGLFDITEDPATQIGPTNDLMGFTAGKEDGVYYASGHPGKGSGLPNPLGLIRSTDGGETWEQLSRQGESDFHALAVTKTGIVAFDGSLATSPDGKRWTPVTADFSPAVLAGHPDSDTVLATTPGGLQRSGDGGQTWALDSSAPLIQFAAFATPAEAVGVQPDGAVHFSTNGGKTWTSKGRINGKVQAITAAKGADGNLRIWAATADGILASTDGGESFGDFDPK